MSPLLFRLSYAAPETNNLIIPRLPGSSKPAREWMGVEPTRAASAAPLNGFEDRGAHQDSTTPSLRTI